MTKYIVNVGLARCGTTATDSYFRNLDSISTPRDVKELKCFLSDGVTELSYQEHFNNPSAGLFFESSPPYAHVGLDRFMELIGRIKSALGCDVIILFCIRNLVSRAFSHYWHDIESHYSKFGRLWSVREGNDGRRLADLYQKPFPQALRGDPDKFLPSVGQMVFAAVEAFGRDNVRIAYTSQLSACVSDLMDQVGIRAGECIEVPKLTGMRAPLYLELDDPQIRSLLVKFGNDKGIYIKDGACLLIRKRDAELLDGHRFNFQLLKASSERWTYTFETSNLKKVVTHYLSEQFSCFESMNDEIFLNNSKSDVLQDLMNTPEILSVSRVMVDLDHVESALAKLEMPSIMR